MGTSREGQRTVLWSRALVWTLCALTGCASSVPDHASQLPQKTVQSNGYRCFTDADVPPNDRQAVETAALAFVRAAVGANASDAYAMMTATTRSIGSADAFAAMIRAKREEAGPYSDIGVAHTYLIENTGHGTEAICGLATSRKWIAVELKPERKQAYVVISARTLNNGLASDRMARSRWRWMGGRVFPHWDGERRRSFGRRFARPCQEGKRRRPRLQRRRALCVCTFPHQPRPQLSTGHRTGCGEGLGEPAGPARAHGSLRPSCGTWVEASAPLRASRSSE